MIEDQANYVPWWLWVMFGATVVAMILTFLAVTGIIPQGGSSAHDWESDGWR